MINYDKLASDYARHRRVHPEVVRDLIAIGSVGATARVLEVGCGTGNYIVALASLTGCRCWGVDPSGPMLAEAKKRSEKISFKLGRAEILAFPPGFFDVVFSVDVIHHLDDHRAYFGAARRVLKPGGSVCTVTDSEWIIRHRQPLAAYFPETAEVDLQRYPRLSYLREIMAQVGFRKQVERTVEVAYQLADSGLYRAQAYSVLHLIPQSAFRQGLERMERDLQAGPIQGVSRYVLLWGTKWSGD